jgi:hypothetical protein
MKRSINFIVLLSILALSLQSKYFLLTLARQLRTNVITTKQGYIIFYPRLCKC